MEKKNSQQQKKKEKEENEEMSRLICKPKIIFNEPGLGDSIN